MIVLLALWLWQAQAKPQPQPPPKGTPLAEMPCKINYLPFHWITPAKPVPEATSKKYGPPPPLEHQGFTIQGMGNCDFTKQKPAPPKGFEKLPVTVKGPNLAFVELPLPQAKK